MSSKSKIIYASSVVATSGRSLGRFALRRCKVYGLVGCTEDQTKKRCRRWS